MKIYVGNLNFKTQHQTLEDAFAEHGQVEEVFIATDRMTGRSRGFAFVTMPSDDEAATAIEAVNGKEVDGRTLTVNEARPRTEGAGQRGGGGGGGGRRY